MKTIDFEVKLTEADYKVFIKALRYHYGPVPAVPPKMGLDENNQPKEIEPGIPERPRTEQEIEQILKAEFVNGLTDTVQRAEQDMAMREAAGKVQPIKLH